jgi:hypothetical protein
VKLYECLGRSLCTCTCVVVIDLKCGGLRMYHGKFRVTAIPALGLSGKSRLPSKSCGSWSCSHGVEPIQVLSSSLAQSLSLADWSFSFALPPIFQKSRTVDYHIVALTSWLTRSRIFAPVISYICPCLLPFFLTFLLLFRFFNG